MVEEVAKTLFKHDCKGPKISFDLQVIQFFLYISILVKTKKDLLSCVLFCTFFWFWNKAFPFYLF